MKQWGSGAYGTLEVPWCILLIFQISTTLEEIESFFQITMPAGSKTATCSPDTQPSDLLMKQQSHLRCYSSYRRWVSVLGEHHSQMASASLVSSYQSTGCHPAGWALCHNWSIFSLWSCQETALQSPSGGVSRLACFHPWLLVLMSSGSISVVSIPNPYSSSCQSSFLPQI